MNETEKNSQEKSFDGSNQLPPVQEKKLLDSGEINIQEISAPLLKARLWIMIIGIISIISGIASAFSIIGIVIAWLPIILGVFLIQTSLLLKKVSVNYNAEDFLKSLDKLRIYFTVSAISTIVILTVMLIFSSFAISTFISILNN